MKIRRLNESAEFNFNNAASSGNWPYKMSIEAYVDIRDEISQIIDNLDQSSVFAIARDANTLGLSIDEERLYYSPDATIETNISPEKINQFRSIVMRYCDEQLNEASSKQFYIDEIVSAPGGKTETERHSFATCDELKQYVKDASLTKDNIANVGGCEVKDILNEEVDKLHTKPNGEYLVKADSGKGYTAFNRNDVAIGGIDDEDADSDDKAIAKFKKNEYSECLNEEYFDTAEYRIQKYEDDIPELMAGMHADYVEGKLDAARYAEVLKRVYDVLADCDYKYAMTTPVETMANELNESSNAEEALVEGIIKDEPAIDDPAVDTATESVECEEDTSDCEEEFDYDDEYSNDYDEHLDECSGVRAHRAIMGEDIDDIADDFADREEPLEDKSEDIEFVMTEYVAESFLVDFVEKVDALTYKVGANDHVVTVVFDPKCHLMSTSAEIFMIL